MDNLTTEAWTPITLEELLNHIEAGEKNMSVDLRKWWNLMRLMPQKWEESEYGKEGCGFWVVGLIGRKVIWYNDIEDGFNISPYTILGKIEEYRCEQDELNHALIKLTDSF
ncbi:hypothetical protein [Siphonobacter curvatus]|uniref:hypothetical protein n=1 Tax=Siphonobacter curvatus TaxID=2094562 RepID=UPI001A9C8020|nr:hypothetical protein [Siphonobacter curvatus]